LLPIIIFVEAIKAQNVQIIQLRHQAEVKVGRAFELPLTIFSFWRWLALSNITSMKFDDMR
jgi:hypothetical protein